jgi:hypothetical protein
MGSILLATLVALEALQIEMLQINWLASSVVQLSDLYEDIFFPNRFIEIVRIASGLTTRIILLLLDTFPDFVIILRFVKLSLFFIGFPRFTHIFDHLSL